MSVRAVVLWLTCVLVLSLHSRHEIGRERALRCALDGNRIEPVREVDLLADGQVLARFCSLTCAQEWPERPVGGYWQVRDEISGRPLDAARAQFVASRVITVPARHERIHAFADWVDARAHAEQFGGSAVPNPLEQDPRP